VADDAVGMPVHDAHRKLLPDQRKVRREAAHRVEAVFESRVPSAYVIVVTRQQV
jgi:hypothetical protein